MKIIISGIVPFDGSYELDFAEKPLTTNEWSWVRKFSNYLPLTMAEGLEGGDPSLMCVFALIALVRNGDVDKSERSLRGAFEALASAPFDGEGITVDFSDEENPASPGGEADPPPPERLTPPPSEPDLTERPSGSDSPSESVSQLRPLSGSGSQG